LSHAGAHSFDDQAAFQFGDGSDDHNYGPAQRAACVDDFAERNLFDVEPAQFVDDIEESLHRSGDPV
jgi:hypothetical protein